MVHITITFTTETKKRVQAITKYLGVSASEFCREGVYYRLRRHHNNLKMLERHGRV